MQNENDENPYMNPVLVRITIFVGSPSASYRSLVNVYIDSFSEENGREGLPHIAFCHLHESQTG